MHVLFIYSGHSVANQYMFFATSSACANLSIKFDISNYRLLTARRSGLKAGNEVHHIVKVANGNNDTNYDLDNLIYVCIRCYRKIEGMNVEEILLFI